MSDPDAIARRAYELFLARGSEPGHEMEDWLQAEADLNAAAAPAEELSLAPEAGEESEPATERNPRASRKRTGGARRMVRQSHTH